MILNHFDLVDLDCFILDSISDNVGWLSETGGAMLALRAKFDNKVIVGSEVIVVVGINFMWKDRSWQSLTKLSG